MGKSAVVLNKPYKFLACAVDYRKSFMLFAFRMAQQRITERHNRRYGIHDFVSKHTYKLNPRVDFLIGKLALDVAEGNNPHTAPFQECVGLARREVFHRLLYLVNVRYHLTLQKFLCSTVVAQHHPTAFLNHDNARVDRIKYKFKVFLSLHLLVARMHQYVLHPVQRPVKHSVACRLVALGKAEAIVAVVDSVEKEGYLSDGRPVAPPEIQAACGRNDGKQEQKSNIKVHTSLFCYTMSGATRQASTPPATGCRHTRV